MSSLASLLKAFTSGGITQGKPSVPKADPLTLQALVDILPDVDKVDELDFKPGDKVVFHQIARWYQPLEEWENHIATVKSVRDGLVQFEEEQFNHFNGKKFQGVPITYIRRFYECDVDLSDI